MSTQTTDTGLSQEGSVEDLHRAVRDHYDKLVDLYEDLWGEHIHHGYWDRASTPPPEAATRRDRREHALPVARHASRSTSAGWRMKAAPGRTP